ncbi:MAG: arginine repressor [Bacillota bacterium]|uniref:Arginine repressor n=1 Tax=Thermanaerosceptrum fracticalcis TaxID=1712410 RepID=A0A7G6E0E4_THEFR|nr:arginine repressor [Thermanaerosceptrum fracticalcis]QNB45548.1 arginine repressor [Thermanaerosceptrum fracticalcis]
MKTRRQKKIIEIIQNNIISTQEELAEALRNEGFEVTQATVSRDIKELRLVKIPTGQNSYKYGVPNEQGIVQNEDRLRRMMQELVTGMDYSENIVVLRTYPGNAHGVASLIDAANWKEVIGTVAGDDTILLVVKPTAAVPALMQKIRELME